MGLKSELKVFSEYVKINLASAMEYRLNFIIRIITMMLNDLVWIIFWSIFFAKFNNVNGWGMREMMMLYAVTTLGYGTVWFFLGNRNMLARTVAEGGLDFYLTMPKSTLFHFLISKSTWFGAGDMMFGIIMGIISFELSQWPLFIVMSLLSAVIFLSFSVIAGCISFFIGNAQQTSETLSMGFLSFAMYPRTMFQGWVKFILLTVIPAAFVGGIPVEIIKSFDLKWFLITAGVAAALFSIMITLFRIGLKRYESGNMIVMRG